MHKLPSSPMLVVALALAPASNVTLAEDRSEPAPTFVRKMFVPFEDLEVLLEDQPRRVLLSQTEYEELLNLAKQAPQSRAPRSAMIVTAEYEGVVEDERATITGSLIVDVLEDGLQAVGLNLAGAGLRGATLDGNGAPIGRADDGRFTLFVQGKGQHHLRLDMVVPLETTAARQVLTFLVPTPGAARMRLTVPGDVEVTSGAEVVSRVFDDASEVTRFELLPRRAQVSLVMTLNSRLKRVDRVVVARSVLVDEVTEAYERLHLTSSMAILHRAVDRFQFTVPDGFEITHVRSPQLACWKMGVQDGRRILDIGLREPTTGTVVLNISAVRTEPQLDSWTLPGIEPLDVAGQATVVGLLIEDRLKATSIKAQQLIPINTSVLSRALPATVFEAEPGAPRIRPVVAYYAPQPGFGLAARFETPPPRLLVTTNVLLILQDRAQEVRGGFALLPHAENLFEFDFLVPPGWHVTDVSSADGAALPIERYRESGEASRVHVRLPHGVSAGQQFRVYFQAEQTPPGWLGDWSSVPVELPVFAVVGASREEGAIAVAAHDDISVHPETLDQLTPLDEKEAGDYGLADVGTNLAYRFDTPTYKATLTAKRIRPRLTARTYSFFKIEPDVLVAHYEVVYDVEEARTRQLALLLDESTPGALSVRALDDAGLKEYNSELVDGMRRWTVLLEEGRRGPIRLAVDFQQPLTDQDHADLSLPVVLADGVAYQSGIACVEGSAELDVQVTSDLRQADIGELVDAEYQPGKRLLGAYGFVGATPEVKTTVLRRPVYALPPVIVERAELATLLSTDRVSQTAARYRLRTKASFLEVQLPPGSKLWSAELDGKPAKPQRESGKLLLSLPAETEGTLRDLRIVYETPVPRIAFRANVELPAPTLWLRAKQDTASQRVPTADLLWHLHLPTGTRVVRAGGTVITQQVPVADPAIVTAARHLYRLSGGANLFYGGLPSLSRARESARRPMADGRAAAPAVVRPGQTDETQLDEETAERLDSLGYVSSSPEDAAPARVRSDRSSVDLDSITSDDKLPQVPAPKTPKRAWALRGRRSLKIDLASSGDRQLTFHSLGEEPRLAVTLISERRFDALAWGLGLVVGLIGLTLRNRSVRARALYLVSIGLVTTLLSLVTGMPELILFCNACFYVACLLMVWYLIAGLVKALGRLTRRVRTPVAATTGVIVLSVLAGVSTVHAESPRDETGPFVIEVVEPPAPVTVPDDAIIIPYDPESTTGINAADQLLVPYDRFVELRNLAYPDEEIDSELPPAPYSLAGASFSAALEGDEFLLVKGSLHIEVYAKGHVTIPLPIEGGVLARADLDGRPARLGIAEVSSSPLELVAQLARSAGQANSTPTQLLVLHASGRGRHQLDLAFRMRLRRRGGWRVATGRLPAAPASELAIRVPSASTEVRLSGVSDRRNFVTTRDNEVVKTTPGAHGAITLQWRPKVSEGMVDRSVTATSSAVLNVQEDGLTATWHLTLRFRNAGREFFSLQVPRDYLVTKVEGDNVRGWEVRPAEDHQELAISLLNPAKDAEDFTVHLWRKGRVGEGSFAAFDAPTVGVDEAALHRGQLVIRKSPLLDVRTVTTAGMTRIDLPEGTEDSPDGGARSPLGIRPHAAYRFVTMPCSVRLSASPVRSRMAVTVQTLLRIGQRRRSLEARFNLRIQDRRRHHFDLLLPADLDVEHVSAPGTFEWSLTDADDQQLLSIHLASGRMDQVPIIVRGALGHPGAVDAVPLPRLRVLDAGRQYGDIVVQVDPSLDVRATDLKHCNTVPLKRVYGWLNEDQRQMAQLALHCRSEDYRGALRLSAKRPVVTCRTITNVRVTDRALEETILLDFSIQDAGIRELSFLLPARMKDARINVPLLRQKIVEPASNEPESLVRVRLELQDAVMGELRVLVEDDRMLTRQTLAAPIPIVQTGRTDQRFVVLEAAGRDEVVVEQQENLEVLSRQQKEWRVLVGILGRGLTNAYLVGGGEQEPLLSFMVKDRKTVETAGARIGLAQTQLVLDANGAYRAAHTYRIHNTTEQFLEIEMPSGAELWTAEAAGEPVKPIETQNPAKPRHVRIPLVKTAAGDLDYTVLLKYGGRLAALSSLSSVDLPLIRSVNINAELSQVRLFLPEGYHWFDFDGTMRLVEGEEELAVGYVSYQTKLAKRLAQTLQSEDSFAQLRAAGNLKRLKEEIGQYRDVTTSYGYDVNGQLEQAWLSNSAVVQGAEQQAQALERSMQQVVTFDNRSDLNTYYERQKALRSRDAVKGLDQNFRRLPPPSETSSDVTAEQFDRQWLDANELASAMPKELGEERGRLSIELEEQGQQVGKGRGRQRPRPPAKPAAPQVAQDLKMRELQEAANKEKAKDEGIKKRKRRGARQETIDRYQAQLQKQAGVEPAPRPGPQVEGDVQMLQQLRGEPTVAAGQKFGVPAGLASLDVEVPLRGTVYRFTTPRGDIKISTRAISRPLLANLELLGITALTVLVIAFVYRWVRRNCFLETRCRPLTTAMIIVGLLSIATGMMPVAGLALAIGGLIWKIQVRSLRPAPQ